MRRILIVDDEKAIIRFFKAAFHDNNTCIYGAENVTTALDVLKKEPIDVVVSDIILTEQNGIVLLEQIKRDYPDVHVIMMTGAPSIKTATEALRLGACDYIEKPLKTDIVYKTIDQAFRLKALIEEKNQLEKDNAAYQIQLEKKILDQTRDLEDRLLKLNCLYELSRLCEPKELSIPHIIEKTVALIPLAFSLKDDVSVRIIYDKISYESNRYNDHQPSLDRPILIKGNPMGSVKICIPPKACSNSDYVFTTDDDRLLQSVCQSLEQMITQKINQDTLDITYQQLFQNEKMAAIGQIAAGVAHEINNPTGFVGSNLRTLGGYMKDMELLISQYRKLVSYIEQDHSLLTDTLGNHVESIRTHEKELDLDYILKDTRDLIEESLDGIEKTKQIVHDLKVFAHPGENKKVLANINRNIDLTLNVVWNELKYKVTLIKDYGDIPEINCYPQQLSQVFANILVNASQAIDTKGEVKIKTQNCTDHIKVIISDTGAGIPPDVIPKIFDPFFTTKKVGKGTGLGMNVAYNIIKKHLGTIDVDSTQGKGTSFTIKLPVA